MSLPEFFFDRVTADIGRQMDGVLALAEQLARQRLPADAQACVAGVAEAAAGVRRTLDSAVDLKAVTNQGLTLTAAPVRLRELVDGLQARWQARGVTLTVSYDGDPEASVLGDGHRLLQVFDGFIGEAACGVRQGAVEASLRVVPHGEGFRLEGRVRGARDPAWECQPLEARLREVDARFGLDVALGVMLARRIVDGHGGILRNETNGGPSETVAFEIALPSVPDAPAAEVAAGLRPAHVLVVDDNATNRMVAQTLCEMFDCTSEAAVDGLEAVDAARSGRFDLILMDIRMPRMDGVSAARAIRALPGPAGRAPIIALTANAEPEDALAYVAAGMNGVVEKPMKPEHLLRALREALDRPDDVAAA
ncbi:MAG: response regulator [Phenylobacterium sp.]